MSIMRIIKKLYSKLLPISTDSSAINIDFEMSYTFEIQEIRTGRMALVNNDKGIKIWLFT